MAKTETSLPVDLVRTIAMVFIIWLHAANEPHQIITLPLMSQAEIWRWWTVNIYDSFTRIGVPLFVMLTGALLLQPSKIEPLGVFFKKRLVATGSMAAPAAILLAPHSGACLYIPVLLSS